MAKSARQIRKGVRRRRRRITLKFSLWKSEAARRLSRWRETAPHRLQARMRDGDRGGYGVWTEQPLIFFVHDGIHTDAPKPTLSPLFEGLGERRSWFFVTHRWNKEDDASTKRVVDWERQHHARHPAQNFVHLCGTRRQCDLFASAGLDSVFCSHNALIDEYIFKPDAKVTPRFDALYDARFAAFKRHHLASEVSSLALMYTQRWVQRWPRYEWESRRKLRHAHDFNREAGNGRYRSLTPTETADKIRACRVGLSLSEEEGANYASIQYLLCGLGVVSTESRGGRDEFFDSTTALIVDADAAAVGRGVEELVHRKLDPNAVRSTTMKTVAEHRRRLLDRIQQIYESEGIERNARSDWNQNFSHKMLQKQSHAAVIESLKRATSN